MRWRSVNMSMLFVLSIASMLLMLSLSPLAMAARDTESVDNAGASAETNTAKEEAATLVQIVAPDADEQTREALVAAWRALGANYTPRTEHLLQDGRPRYINRLIREASPYLLQHAHNPVNWYPWNEEAFAAAEAADKPVFLSIGYATCHWCHVMEQESFEDENIAAYLNDHYIAIKVDREQLPDVDALYMTAVQLINGAGGWPMSSFLDTAGRPFFGGTYFPPEQFHELLERISSLWSTQRDTLLEHADTVAEALAAANQLSELTRKVGHQDITAAREFLLSNEDQNHGGFGRAPKFPQESTLLFLLDQALRPDGADMLRAADFALERMAAGGIHDQIGGGFHRYSVDAQWLVPHFEKMLYNQAGLARAYLRAWLITGREDHLLTVRSTLDYVLREMTSEEGLFFSATDADSEGREGAYFVWTPEQLKQVLANERDVEIATSLWGVDGFGNFEQGETNVLHRPLAHETLAESLALSMDQLAQKREELAARLRLARAEREAPLRDEKALTGWNGLIITAFAEAGFALNDQRYLTAASRAADALWGFAWNNETGELLRSRYRGETSIEARQTDFAWLAEALLALYDALGTNTATTDKALSHERWLYRARLLTDSMITQFRDEANGGFFLGSSAVSGMTLVAQPKDIYDASTPSGNGVALRILSRLANRTGERRYREEADRLIAAFAGTLARQPGGQSSLLTGLAEHLDGETGALRYAGRGNARVSARALPDQQVEVRIELADGWHVNSDAPLQDYLIPTQLMDDSDQILESVQYPVPVERTLGFQRATLSLFEGQTVLRAALPDGRSIPDTTMVAVKVQLQVCSDELCLAPETIVLDVSTAMVK